MIRTCQYWTWPRPTSAASDSACTAITDWVVMSSRRLETRSASTPAKKDSSSIGRNCSVPTSPSRNGELVSSSTSHDWATDCIHVPMSETSWPAVKSRKSRFARARSGPGRREGGRATR